ncbi:MAG: helix-turn-helix domain-containing protein [Methanomassiliicoccales archaeon]
MQGTSSYPPALKSRNAEEIFRALGLTAYESRALLTLLVSEKEMNYREIMNASNIPYGRIYSVLQRLYDRGCILITDANPKRYKAKPLGRLIEDSFITPTLKRLFEFEVTSDQQFRDIWISEVCSLVPVFRLNDRKCAFELLHGLEQVRHAEYDALERARNTVRLCIPSAGFLDRNRREYIPMDGRVEVEIVTTLKPSEFTLHISHQERRLWRQERKGGSLDRVLKYYLHPSLTERMLLVDDDFVSFGSRTLPVVAMVYSKKICKQYKAEFDELKRQAVLVPAASMDI